MKKHHATQREYWRSLEHLAAAPEVRKFADAEFGAYDPNEMLTLSQSTRRRFLQLMGASMALAGLTITGCRRYPEEKLAPYTSNPKDRLPGVPERYATVMELSGVAQPLLVTSFDGRPIKIEGHPTHPFSQTVSGRQGAATPIAQASVLDIYDSTRSHTVGDATSGQPVVSTYEKFNAAFDSLISAAGKGERVAVLIEPTSSVTTARLKALALAKLPSLSWFEYEPLSRDNASAGVKLATGKPGRVMLNLDKAAVVVSIDDDILGGHPAQVRYAADWAVRRRSVDNGSMSRVYAFESALTLTGTAADVRVPLKPSHASDILASLAAALGVEMPGWVPSLTPDEKKVIEQIISELPKGSTVAPGGSVDSIALPTAASKAESSPGSAVITVGAHLSPAAHHLALLINEKIGAIGSTLTIYEDDSADRPSHKESIASLVAGIKAGKFDTLLILGGNPAYDAPADLDFAGALKTVANSIHLSTYADETSGLCKWHVPRAHYLEAWGDARAWDGSASIVQPLIEPLFGGKSIDEVLAILAGVTETPATQPTTAPATEPATTQSATTQPAATQPAPAITSYELVRQTWADLAPAGTSADDAWQQVLHDGYLAGSQFKIISGSIKPVSAASAPPTEPSTKPTFEVRFLASTGLYDGRFANNGWLQEMPEPLTKIVWDNAVLISRDDAEKAGVSNGDLLDVTVGRATLQIAAYILAGQPVGVLGLPLGYGRTAAGPVGNGVGFNTYQLRSTGEFEMASGSFAKSGQTYQLAMTQDHYLIDSVGFEGREERTGDKGKSAELIREGTLQEYTADKQLFKRTEDGGLALQLYDAPMVFNEPHAWGMAVDMNTCIGCGACVIACQAENNIPVVGKDQAIMGRAMHWIRIDRYFKGDGSGENHPVDDPNPDVVFQPVMCQHCENAPCEQVCPVGATMHDTEGLNVMVYNRCIGTRYCANNCPYKVRRFNYLDWQSQDPRHDKFPVPFLGIPDQQQLTQVDEIKRMVFNPEVTVRMRGVMEKCTYCVQRIHAVTVADRREGQYDKGGDHEVKDGDILTACQQTCPTQAIVFGNLNDPSARVSQLQKGQRSYKLLNDLDTKPRTQYLGRVRNPGEVPV